MHDDLETEKMSYSQLWKKKTEIFTYKLLSKFGRDKSKRADWCYFFCLAECLQSYIWKSTFVWRPWKKIFLLTDHGNYIKCPFKLNGKRGWTLANPFYPRAGQICGDIHFDNERFTNQKTKPGDGKYNFFSVDTN